MSDGLRQRALQARGQTQDPGRHEMTAAPPSVISMLDRDGENAGSVRDPVVLASFEQQQQQQQPQHQKPNFLGGSNAQVVQKSVAGVAEIGGELRGSNLCVKIGTGAGGDGILRGDGGGAAAEDASATVPSYTDTLVKAQMAKVIRQQQARLLLLRHASKCKNGPSCNTNFCPQMVELWEHMKTCHDKRCKTAHCLSSRVVLNHFRMCKIKNCEVCSPVKKQIGKTTAHNQTAKEGVEKSVLSSKEEDGKPSSGGRLVSRKCFPILRKLMSEPSGWAFKDPVDPVELCLPDYFEIIKEPMDFRLIEKKLTNGDYSDIDAFQHDCRLVFDNAILYHGENSDIGEMAKELLGVFEMDYGYLLRGKQHVDFTPVMIESHENAGFIPERPFVIHGVSTAAVRSQPSHEADDSEPGVLSGGLAEKVASMRAVFSAQHLGGTSRKRRIASMMWSPFRAGHKEKGEEIFRLESRGTTDSIWNRLFYSESEMEKPDMGSFSLCDPNHIITRYLHWTFRTSFILLITSMIMGFIFFTAIFASLIVWSGYIIPECIGAESFSDWTKFSAPERFADAYHLSWTTFSTVGYGIIAPQTSAGWRDQQSCYGIKILCSSEAFFGVLFSGFCAAVLFGKISRFQSFAQVTFSDPVLVKYGTGVMTNDDDGDKSDEDDDNDSGPMSIAVQAMRKQVTRRKKLKKRLPCPVLEFQVVNNLHSLRGGEIMDATLNAVASVDLQQAEKGVKSSKNNSTKVGIFSSEDSSDEDSLFGSGSSTGRSSKQIIRGDSSSLAAQKAVSKVRIEASLHPFFKRVWVVRHILDVHSPLLTRDARKLMNENHGYWPEELNNYECVRESVSFSQILVSLHGTCNLSGAAVYAQKIYSSIDVSVGYQFVNILFRNRHAGMLTVDTNLINDVKEQEGGGGEPFGNLVDTRDVIT